MSWSEIKVNGEGPAGRQQHAMCASSDNCSIFLFSGQQNNKDFNDLWKYDIAKKQWTQLEAGGDAGDNRPFKRWGATLACKGEKLYMYGGMGAGSLGYLADVWQFDLSNNTWEQCALDGFVPGGRAFHTTVWHDDKLVIFGGMNANNELNDVVICDVSNNFYCTRPDSALENAPPPRKRHSAVVYEKKKEMVVFAGWQGTGLRGDYWSDLFSFNLETMTWKAMDQKGAIPSSRAGHIVGIDREFMFLWGGWGGGTGDFDELHYLDLDDNSWMKQKRGVFPTERYNHAAVTIAGKLYVWGGALPNEKHACTDQFWLLNVARIY